MAALFQLSSEDLSAAAELERHQYVGDPVRSEVWCLPWQGLVPDHDHVLQEVPFEAETGGLEATVESGDGQESLALIDREPVVVNVARNALGIPRHSFLC